MKIAVCVHLYHLDMWIEIENYLKNIKRHYDLYVNFSYEFDGIQIKDFVWEEYVNLYPDLINAGKNNHRLAYQHFLNFGISENRLYKKKQIEVKNKIINFKQDTKIIISANRGVDIGGFLNTYKYIDYDVDLILKLHTKKGMGSDETPSLDLIRRGNNFATTHGKQWFHSLMDGVLGNEEKVEKILNYFENNPESGMVGFRKYNNFSKNIQEMRNLYPIFNIQNHPNESYFVGGTIFWVKNEILKKYIPKNKIDYILNKLPFGYVREPSPNHAIERIFGCMVYLENKEINIIK